MVDTIGPMVRDAERRPRGVEFAHVIGGALGGAATGFVLGAIGAVVGLDRSRPVALIVGIAVIAVVAAVVDAVHEGRKVGLSRQTPRSWRHVLPARAASFLNGFDLGLGWSTRIYFMSYAIASLAALVSAHAFAGAAIVGAFGAGRALFVVVAQRRSDGSLSIDSIAARRGRVVALNTVALVQFAAVAAAVAL